MKLVGNTMSGKEVVCEIIERLNDNGNMVYDATSRTPDGDVAWHYVARKDSTTLEAVADWAIHSMVCMGGATYDSIREEM